MERGDDFLAGELGHSQDMGTLSHTLMERAPVEGHAVGGMPLGMEEYREIVDRGDRRQIAWHWDVVRLVVEVETRAGADRVEVARNRT